MAQALQPLLQVNIGVGPNLIEVPADERDVHEAISALAVPRPTGRQCLPGLFQVRAAAEVKESLCTSLLPYQQAGMSGRFTAGLMQSLESPFAPYCPQACTSHPPLSNSHSRINRPDHSGTLAATPRC